MQRHITQTEALKARLTSSVLPVAPPATKVRSNQTSVVVWVSLDKLAQRRVARAEEIDEFVAGGPEDFGDALRG